MAIGVGYPLVYWPELCYHVQQGEGGVVDHARGSVSTAPRSAGLRSPELSKYSLVFFVAVLLPTHNSSTLIIKFQVKSEAAP